MDHRERRALHGVAQQRLRVHHRSHVHAHVVVAVGRGEADVGEPFREPAGVARVEVREPRARPVDDLAPALDAL